MNWQDMYECALERIKQLNTDLRVVQEILRSYLPVITKDDNEKR